MEYIEKNREVTVNTICSVFSVSPATARRYLSKLEDDDLIIRTHGGAKRKNPEFLVVKPLRYKSEIGTSVKDRVARYAASLIDNSQMVFIDSGSSTLALGKYIRNKDIYVVTLNVELALELGNAGIKTYVMPGFLNVDAGSVYCEQAIDFINEMHFDICIVSITAVNTEEGMGCTGEIASRAKRAAILHSDRAYIIADSSKYRKKLPFKVADFSEVTMITDKLDDYLPEDGQIIVVDEIN